ncbi:MAG: SH3 domain-containing protein, partial [Desulfovibrionaceae bacterium]
MQRQHLLAVALLAALLGALLAPAAALAWGEVRAAKSDLNVRAKRSPTAEIVTSLKAGDKIRVDFREGDWVAVFPLDQQARDLTKAVGFVNAKYLGG